VIESPADSHEIADTVAVALAVAKAARIDLINDGGLPPRLVHGRLALIAPF
jgi:hypothetical protein